jgi:hypothetical protein
MFNGGSIKNRNKMKNLYKNHKKQIIHAKNQVIHAEPLDKIN